MFSVKDLRIEREPTPGALGEGYFNFSDRYSVFDWGEMPDLIPAKGQALAMMGGYNFELLEEAGLYTHYRGMVEGGDCRLTTQLSSPSDRMAVSLAWRPELTYDEGYQYPDLEEVDNYLIPLEVIFRNSIPEGSSIRRRYDPQDLGFDIGRWPEEELPLSEPLVEYSTKLEEKDRYLEIEEAFQISGLTEGEFDQLEEVAEKVNAILTDHAEAQGFDHLDGKIECVYSKGKILVADAVGTFDENRFSWRDFQISKEVLRQWYRENDPDWYRSLDEGRKLAKQKGSSDWKSFVERDPKPLTPDFLDLVSKMYRAGTNHWLNKKIFDVEELAKVTEEIKQWVKIH
ncbi:MAG: phosphoribosylaminoimidazolesuccinocarboxamide synthase [Candidatus Bipolaricaulota bacterium]